MVRPDAPAPHLRPALGAGLLAAGLLTAIQISVGARLERDLPFYAAHAMSFKVRGNALQRTAFRAPGELLVYGSSELDRPTLNRADAFFRLRPSGFAVFPVGRGGSTCLLILQRLAAAGDAARGRQVVIFLSPTWFLQPGVEAAAVGANLGVVQINAWVFGGELGPALKSALARRMEAYRDALKDEPLVATGVQCLVAPTAAHRWLFAALLPLGKLQQIALCWCDYGVILWEIVFPQARWHVAPGYLQNAYPVTGGPIDWDRLLAEAGGPTQQSHTPPEADTAPDETFLARLAASQEFGDLELLLRVLRELRMQALFISQPFDGAYPSQGQVSPRARRAYDERTAALIRGADFPLRDFAEHGDDPAFFDDPLHPSAKAWLFYDREIDRFGARQRP